MRTWPPGNLTDGRIPSLTHFETVLRLIPKRSIISAIVNSRFSFPKAIAFLINFSSKGYYCLFTLLIMTRLMGKQHMAQLSFFDCISGITIGSIAAALITDLSSSAWPQWIGLAIWAVLVLVLQIITLKWRSTSNKERVLLRYSKCLRG